MSMSSMTIDELERFKDRPVYVTCNGEITYNIRQETYSVWNEGYSEELLITKSLSEAHDKFKSYLVEIAA